MIRSLTTSHILPLALAFGLFLTGIACAAFYGWLRFGSSILLTLGESGLAWCF